MSYLPTIRFKDQISGNYFELSLQYPYKIAGTLLTKFNHTRIYTGEYTGEAIYYIVDEYGRTFYLPDNFKSIIHHAINLHNSVYNDEVSTNEDFIIRNIEDQSRNCMRSSGIDNHNEMLRMNHRFDRYDRYDCILYDTIINEYFIYNNAGDVVGGTRFINMSMEPPVQRGRRAELYSPFNRYATIEQIADALPNYEFSTTTATTNRSESHSTTQQMNECLRRPRTEHTITFPSTAHRYDESISNGEYYSTFYREKDRKTYIHQYNYVPKYIKHFIPGESEDTTLLLGAEIEVGGNNNISSDNDKNSTVKKCIQIMNGSDSDEESLIYSTHDGTVQIEFDTMPCSLEFHKNKMNYREMFEYLDKEGYKGHDCETAGLHIHANRSYLGKSRISQELVISKILYILEKFNDEICVIARRNNDYSQFAGEGSKENSLVELYGKYKDKGKRAALNLQHKDTIEFRMFKSTLKYETFILTLEFVKDIIDYAKSVDIEEIELAKWSDLMNCFSTELREYYEFRYQKKVKDISGLTTKQIRKRISKLKSELKNSMNFFQKTKLQKEISNLKKIYKELNKKEKKVIKMKRRIASIPAISTNDYGTISIRNINLRI